MNTRTLRGSRPDRESYFIFMSLLASTRSTCARRAVGCVLVNKEYHVLATGYNGVCRGATHCIDKPCPGAMMPSGTGLDVCEAIHAEENALLQCKDISDIFIAYVTASPCIKCVRLLANTGVKHIVFKEEYPHPEAHSVAIKAGITWTQAVVDQSSLQSLPE